MLIIAASGLFGRLLVTEHVSSGAVSLMTSLTDSKAVLISMVIIFILFIGCFVEIAAATVIFSPVLYPLASQYHFDPIHFGAVVCVALVIGMVTPPVGSAIFVSTAVAKGSFRETSYHVIPFCAVMIVVLMIMAYFPPFTTFLPNYFLK
jgi:C4-dicarboxylate transporter DctM subunit